MKNIKYIGEQIKKIRINKNITQKELAIKSNVSEQTIRRCEQGKFYPRFDSFLSILDT